MGRTPLKQCPHCPSRAARAWSYGRTWKVSCPCGASGPTASTQEDAERRWNTRSIASAEATIREANGEVAS